MSEKERKLELIEGDGESGDLDQRGIRDSLRKSGYSEDRIDHLLAMHNPKPYLVEKFRSVCGSVIVSGRSKTPPGLTQLDEGVYVGNRRNKLVNKSKKDEQGSD